MRKFEFSEFERVLYEDWVKHDWDFDYLGKLKFFTLETYGPAPAWEAITRYMRNSPEGVIRDFGEYEPENIIRVISYDYDSEGNLKSLIRYTRASEDDPSFWISEKVDEDDPEFLKTLITTSYGKN